MAETSLLVLSGMGLPDYAARGLIEVLKPLGLGLLVRDVNGGLHDFSDANFRKYSVSIQGSDQQSPAVDMVWVGTALTVDCITELCYLTAGGTPGRSVVPGSSRVDGDFTFYRPRLAMRVVDWNMSTNEYDAAIDWQLNLEEV